MNLTDGLKVLTLPFDQETTDVLIGTYLSRDAAHEDYESAVACGVYLHAAIMVSKDLAGTVAVEQSDHMVREGAEALAAVGFISGLVAFPLVPVTTGLGAAMGGLLGEALHLVTENRLRAHGAEMIPLGCAALILAYPRSSAQAVEPAVTRAVTRVTGEAQGHHLQALKGALTDARQHMPAASA